MPLPSGKQSLNKITNNLPALASRLYQSVNLLFEMRRVAVPSIAIRRTSGL